MIKVSENQVKFITFAEMAQYLSTLNGDIDLSRCGPDNSIFSKSKGLIAGNSFFHFISLIDNAFDLGLNASGCISYWDGYLLTFNSEVPEAKIKEDSLEDKTRPQLLKLAKEAGISFDKTITKDELVLALSQLEAST